MISPIGDDQVKGGYFPIFSYDFLTLNVVIFGYHASLPLEQSEQFVYTFGSLPAETLAGEDHKSQAA